MNIGDDIQILGGENCERCLNRSQRALVLRSASNLQNVGPLATGFLLLASCCWLLITESKILGLNRGFTNLGTYNRNLAATGQGQDTSSQRPVASDGQNDDD